MRKRCLSYLLTLVMVVAGTCINTSTHVRADQNDEIQVESENVDEEEIASPDSPTMRGDIDTTNEMEEIEIDDAAKNWYDDYAYTFEGNRLVLNKYVGTSNEIYVPKNATINGKTYMTDISCGFQAGFGYFSIWSSADANITSIRFQNGFKFPENSSNLFNGELSLLGLNNIDLSGVDTSNVKGMAMMFQCCEGLTSLDLSCFDTSSVTTMRAMFNDCCNIQTLDLSNFDTSKVQYVGYMFSSCTNLKTINLSGCDFSGLVIGSTETDEDYEAPGMFSGCDNLEIIYAPIKLKRNDIKLPTTFYDSNGNVYNYLPTGLKSSIKLARNKNAFKNGWVNKKGTWYYYVNGDVLKGDTVLAKGTINGKTGWYAATDGKLDQPFEGIAKTTTGKWYFARNGVINKSFSGIAQATNGIWYYVNKGVIDRSFSGKIVQATNGKWYYVNKGKPTKTFTGKIAQTTDGKWYYCTNGRPDKSFSGKLAYCTNGEWYYVTEGMIDRSYTGIAEATNGSLYYAYKGKLDRSFTGYSYFNGIRYRVVKGIVKR